MHNYYFIHIKLLLFNHFGKTNMVVVQTEIGQIFFFLLFAFTYMTGTLPPPALCLVSLPREFQLIIQV